MTISRSEWFGFDALTLENDGLSLTVVPESGGRIVSMFDKRCRREWLVQPADSHPPRRVLYGSDFESQSAGGWDEMFPTITADTYPGRDQPGMAGGDGYAGVSLPDHGELWSVSWQVTDLTEDGLEMAVEGRALPYRLVRRLTLTEPCGARLCYTLNNLGELPFCYLWAAHPQLACLPDTRIVLPPEVGQVVNVLPSERGELLGPPGTVHGWPETLVADGSRVRLDAVGAPALRSAREIFLPPDAPVGWAGLAQPTGDVLRLSWDAARLPYCGIWIDQGMLNAVTTVAIEPSQGYYASLSRACDEGRVASVNPGVEQTWDVAVTLICGR